MLYGVVYNLQTFLDSELFWLFDNHHNEHVHFISTVQQLLTFFIREKRKYRRHVF